MLLYQLLFCLYIDFFVNNILYYLKHNCMLPKISWFISNKKLINLNTLNFLLLLLKLLIIAI